MVTGDDSGPATRAADSRAWTFLSNHGHVLVHVSREPRARLRDVADAVGITERSAQAILADLEAGGYVTKERVGRRNHYVVHPELAFRHPSESAHPVGALLRIFGPVPGDEAEPSQGPVPGEDVRSGTMGG